MLSSEPATIATVSPSCLQQRSVVGRGRASAGAVRREQDLIAEGLRRLGAVQAVARHRGDDLPAVTRFSVSATGDGGNRAGRALEGRQQGRDGARRGSAVAPRRAPARCRARAAPAPRRPARTLSWRVAPPGTGGRCGRPASAASIASASPTGCSSATCAANVSAAWRITGLPASGRNCFGVSAPNRLPEPAATRMAATRMPAPLPGQTAAVNPGPIPRLS